MGVHVIRNIRVQLRQFTTSRNYVDDVDHHSRCYRLSEKTFSRGISYAQRATEPAAHLLNTGFTIITIITVARVVSCSISSSELILA